MVILVNLYAIKHYNTIQQTTLQIFLTMHLVNRGQFQGIVGQILVNLYDMPHSYTITQYLYHSPAPTRRLSANGILHHLHTENGEFRYNLTVLKSLYRDLGFTANALYFTHVYCYNIIVPVIRECLQRYKPPANQYVPWLAGSCGSFTCFHRSVTKSTAVIPPHYTAWLCEMLWWFDSTFTGKAIFMAKENPG